MLDWVLCVSCLQAVFSYFYSHVDLTISDVATGFLLVSILQKFERQEARERHDDGDHHDDQFSLSFSPDVFTSQYWSSQGLLSGLDRHDDLSLTQPNNEAGKPEADATPDSLNAYDLASHPANGSTDRGNMGHVTQRMASSHFAGSHANSSQLVSHEGPPGEDVLKESNRMFQYAVGAGLVMGQVQSSECTCI